jgi:molecular chaperone GrpE
VSDSKGKPEKISLDDILKEDPSGAPPAEEETIEIVDPGGPPTATGRPIEEIESRLAEAEREKDNFRDLYMRARADHENFRKRVERERAEEAQRATATILIEILPALDNLDRALAQPAEAPGFRDGVALIRRQLGEALRKIGVEPIEALGESFDPVYHEALAAEVRPGFEPNTVIDEVRKGYLLGGRVLRPSLVRVTAAVPGGGAAASGRDAEEGVAGESGDVDGPDRRD